MKKKIIISILAIFLIAGCLAAVYAENAHIGSFSFDVPNGFKVSESSNSKVVLNSSSKDIIVTTDFVEQSSISDYLQSKGFTYTTTIVGNSTVTSASNSSAPGFYSYVGYSFNKGTETATAFVINKNGVDIAVIVINHSPSSSGMMMDRDASIIMNKIMLG